MADVAGKTKRYPSDLTDEEWERIQPLLPEPPKRGRKVSVDLREMLNAIPLDIGHCANERRYGTLTLGDGDIKCTFYGCPSLPLS